jgi:hypothetical protein
MSSISAWKARRQAGRVPGVLERHADKPAIRAYQATLGGKAHDFTVAYDAAATYATRHAREFAEGRAAVADLARKLASWAPLVAGAVPGVAETDLTARHDIPDDLFTATSHVLDLVHDAGDALPFAADLAAELEPALATAQKEWHEAVAADVTYQSLLKAQRDALAVFDAELQRFRRTLAGALGRSHKDYQKLRAEKAHLPDDDDDATAPAPPADAEPPTP